MSSRPARRQDRQGDFLYAYASRHGFPPVAAIRLVRQAGLRFFDVPARCVDIVAKIGYDGDIESESESEWNGQKR